MSEVNFYSTTVLDTNGDEHQVYLPDAPIPIGAGGSDSTSGSSAGTLDLVQVFVMDFINDEVTVTHGAIDGTKRIATT